MRINVEERVEKAKRLFKEDGYNCCQAVVLAYNDIFGLDDKTAASIASGFGGGMGRMREVCGAVSGMFMAAGLKCGYSSPTDNRSKTEHYKLIQDLAAEFRAENGSIICRDLLGLTKPGPDTPTPEPRTEAYYKKRPCQLLVGQCAAILEQELNQ